MDLHEIKQLIFVYRKKLVQHKIRPDVIILYGSQAKGTSRIDSDIDIAVISRNFGRKNGARRLQEGIILNELAYDIDPRIEVVPVGMKAYLDPASISPLLNEIRMTGIGLF